MRLPHRAHTARPWRIHDIAPDFRIEDVWALPTPGDREDFTLLVHGLAAADPSRDASPLVRGLFAVRWKLGALFGWDAAEAGLGGRAPTLRDRLGPDLLDTPMDLDFDALPFSPLYLLGDEFAAEIANATMHGILHLGWIPDGAGGYRGQLAVLVRPNGLRGRVYMAAIKPIRHAIIYPRLLRSIGRSWRTRDGGGATVSG